MKYIPGLNGLRAIAVFLVVFYHWGLPPIAGLSYLNNILPDGKFGVNMFFVLSGFLITTILLREKERHDKSEIKNLITNFYIRRSLRIFPVYYLCVFVLSFLHLPNFAPHLPFYITFTENFHIYFNRSYDSFSNTWSLAVEEQFYLIWPFIIFFVKKENLLYVLLLFILLGPAFSIFQTYVLHNGFNDYILTPDCFDPFGLGALTAYLPLIDKTVIFKKSVKLVLPFAIILFFYWKLATGGGHAQYFRRFSDSIISVAMILFCLSTSFLYVKKYVLENKVVKQLGIISYGIYLFHYPLPDLYAQLKNVVLGSSNATPGLVKNNLLDYTLMFLVLIAFSFLCYYAFEHPILRLKNRFSYSDFESNTAKKITL